jgi:hypothetical protein
MYGLFTNGATPAFFPVHFYVHAKRREAWLLLPSLLLSLLSRERCQQRPHKR